MTPVQFGRFTLRDLDVRDDDFSTSEKLSRLTMDPVTMRYMGFKRHSSSFEAYLLIQRYQNSPSRWFGVFADNDLLGVVGFEVERHNACISIMFRNDWEARGAGRQFSVPFVDWIFTHPQIWRVWAYCHVDNVPVQNVLRRMGAEREGRLRRFEVFPNISDEPQDCYVYSIVRK